MYHAIAETIISTIIFRHKHVHKTEYIHVDLTARLEKMQTNYRWHLALGTGRIICNSVQMCKQLNDT
jgi:hypothetical protein